jgi:hypothetical protein
MGDPEYAAHVQREREREQNLAALRKFGPRRSLTIDRALQSPAVARVAPGPAFAARAVAKLSAYAVPVDAARAA